MATQPDEPVSQNFFGTAVEIAELPRKKAGYEAWIVRRLDVYCILSGGACGCAYFRPCRNTAGNSADLFFLTEPTYDAIDGSGDVWVVDPPAERMVEFSSSGTLIRTIETGEGPPEDRLLAASGIAINKAAGLIYVADHGANHVVEYSAETGEPIRVIGAGQMLSPTGVAVDTSGDLFVVDSANNRIDKFSSSGTLIGKYGSPGSGNGQFLKPLGIAVDASNHVYVADAANERVQELSSEGTYLGQFGSRGSGEGQFTEPYGIAIDPRSGNIFVADEANKRVEIFSAAGVFLGKFGSNGLGEAQFALPQGIAIDSAGGVYVADAGDYRVEKWLLPARLTGQPGWYSLQEESGGEPVIASVNVAGGNLMVESEDLPAEPATANVRLDRYYNSQSTSTAGPLGPGWSWDAGPDVYLSDFGETVVLHGPSEYIVTLHRETNGTYTAPQEFEGTLVKNSNGTYTLTEMTGIIYQFNTAGAMTSYSDSEANSFTVADTTLSGQSVLHSLSPASGKALEVAYSGTHVVTSTDPAGHVRHYEYNAQGRLSSYTDPAGHKTEYGYDANGYLNKLTTPNGTTEAITTTAGKVTEVTITPKGEAAYSDKFEYVAPSGPTCNATRDTGETVVTHPPAKGTPEVYCWEGLGEITAYSGPPSEAEEPPTESGTEQQELPANTCYPNPNFPAPQYCGQEDPLPENEEGAEGLFSPLVSVPDLGPTHYGIADNNALSKFNMFTKSQFTALHVVNVRRTFPWNAAWEAKHSTIPQNKITAEAAVVDFQTWVKDVKALSNGTGQPTVSFNYCAQSGEWVDPLAPSIHLHCTEAPKEPEYAAAVKEFLETPTLNEVKYFSAWNEPNNNKIVGEPKAETAGEYWRALDTLCKPPVPKAPPRCLVAAGEFADSVMPRANDAESKGGKYFAEYFKGMGFPPNAHRWAWHAYSDGEATYELHSQPSKWWSRFKSFLSAINRVTKNTRKPDIWLTEQGAIYSALGKEDSPAHNGHAATEIMHAYVEDGSNQLTRQSKQIQRFFYYQMRGEPFNRAGGTWDSGLLYPTGTVRARPMYWIYKHKTPKS